VAAVLKAPYLWLLGHTLSQLEEAVALEAHTAQVETDRIPYLAVSHLLAVAAVVL